MVLCKGIVALLTKLQKQLRRGLTKKTPTRVQATVETRVLHITTNEDAENKQLTTDTMKLQY
eukprot:3512203-Amphidinium_carterae.1